MNMTREELGRRVVKLTLYGEEMTDDDMYNALFVLSKVDIIRRFPKRIEIIEEGR